LFQVGEFAFVIAQEALRLEVINREQFQYFLSISLLSMIVSPLVYQVAPAFSGRLTQASATSGNRRKAGESSKSGLSGHAIIIGYGLAGRMAAAGLDAAGIDYFVVDLNFKVINSLKSRGLNAVYGDASKDEILEAVHADKARLVIVAVAGRHMVPAIVAALDPRLCKAQVIVRSAFDREATEILEIRPGIDVVVSEVESAKVLVERALMTFGHDPDAVRAILAQVHDQV